MHLCAGIKYFFLFFSFDSKLGKGEERITG